MLAHTQIRDQRRVRRLERGGDPGREALFVWGTGQVNTRLRQVRSGCGAKAESGGRGEEGR